MIITILQDLSVNLKNNKTKISLSADEIKFIFELCIWFWQITT